MLDEPTNHLDLSSIQWLEDTLKKYRGTVLIISHDRYFMNSVCDCMAEISMRRLVQYEGNYDQFTVKRQADIERQIREYKLQQAEIARQQAIIQRYRMYNREKSIRAAGEPGKAAGKRWKGWKGRWTSSTCASPLRRAAARATTCSRCMALPRGFEGAGCLKTSTSTCAPATAWPSSAPNGVGKSTLLNIIARKLEGRRGRGGVRRQRRSGLLRATPDRARPGKGRLNELWGRLSPPRPRPRALGAGAVPLHRRRTFTRRSPCSPAAKRAAFRCAN